MVNKYVFMISCSFTTLICLAEPESFQASVSIPTQQSTIQVDINPHQKPDSFNKSIAASVAPGMVIGAANGLAWHVIDKTFPGPKFCWLLWPVEFITRKTVEIKVMQLMTEHRIKHNPDLLVTTAWLTDWVAYLLAWKFIKL